MFHLSDRFAMPICNDCGMVAVYNATKKQAYCKNCKEKNSQSMNTLKKANISICSLPYACKLLFQELMAMGINPRIGMKK